MLADPPSDRIPINISVGIGLAVLGSFFAGCFCAGAGDGAAAVIAAGFAGVEFCATTTGSVFGTAATAGCTAGLLTCCSGAAGSGLVARGAAGLTVVRLAT